MAQKKASKKPRGWDASLVTGEKTNVGGGEVSKRNHTKGNRIGDSGPEYREVVKKMTFS